MTKSKILEVADSRVKGPFRNGFNWAYKAQNDAGNWYITDGKDYHKAAAAAARAKAFFAVRLYLETTEQLEDIDAPRRTGGPAYKTAIKQAVFSAGAGGYREKFRRALEDLL